MKNPVVVSEFQARTQQSIEAFVHLLERTRGHLHSDASAHEPRGLQNWADRFLDEIGYFIEVRRMEKTAENADNRVKNLKEMLGGLDGEEAGPKRLYDRLERFLEEVSLDTEREEEEEGPENAVTLITMHSCKGLEFPNVYIVGMEDGLLPHERSKETNTIDEERRLFYVAITRAQQTLTVSHCAGRMKYGQVSPRHPSPFLRELPDALVEHASEKAKQPVAPASGRDLFAAMRASID